MVYIDGIESFEFVYQLAFGVELVAFHIGLQVVDTSFHVSIYLFEAFGVAGIPFERLLELIGSGVVFGVNFVVVCLSFVRRRDIV